MHGKVLVISADLRPRILLHLEAKAAPKRRRTMKRSRFTEGQIIGILTEQDAGMATTDVCRKHGVSSATF